METLTKKMEVFGLMMRLTEVLDFRNLVLDCWGDGVNSSPFLSQTHSGGTLLFLLRVAIFNVCSRTFTLF